MLFLDSVKKKQIEVKRIARCALVLNITGILPKGETFSQIALHLKERQQSDGGWGDVEESILSVKLLSLMKSDFYSHVEKGKEWLLLQRKPNGGWGNTHRDIARLIQTSLLFHLLPELSDQKGINWLKKEWKKDIQSNTRLSYKGGFFLMGLLASGISAKECPLILDTYAFLANEQNNDGGFGPWKGHPIGSDPWSTGIVLVGLLSYPELVKRTIIEKAVAWLAKTQLPNGLWPYHYIEEGSAYALWGLVEALKYLAKNKP